MSSFAAGTPLILHEEELYAAWNNAVQNQPFDKIEPLK
jgi:hypothetical protein